MNTYPTVDQLGKLAQAKAREAVAAAAQLETALSRWWAVDQDKLEQLVAAAKTANSRLNANLRQLRTARTRATLNRLIWVNATAKYRDDAALGPGGRDIFEHLFENAPDSPASDDILVRGNPAELTRVVTAIFTCLSRRLGVACPPIPELPEQPQRPLYRLRRHIHALLSEATVQSLIRGNANELR